MYNIYYIYIYKNDGAILEYANVLKQVSSKATDFFLQNYHIFWYKSYLHQWLHLYNTKTKS